MGTVLPARPRLLVRARTKDVSRTLVSPRFDFIGSFPTNLKLAQIPSS